MITIKLTSKPEAYSKLMQTQQITAMLWDVARANDLYNFIPLASFSLYPDLSVLMLGELQDSSAKKSDFTPDVLQATRAEPTTFRGS